jgi:hypothetical protein
LSSSWPSPSLYGAVGGLDGNIRMSWRGVE